jgi:transcriptional regulator
MSVATSGEKFRSPPRISLRSCGLLAARLAYITPNWYRSKAEHGKVVPTWNYVALHAYARPEVIEDAEWLRRHVAELTAQEEKLEPRPWALSDAPDEYVARMLRGIVGFRLRVVRLEGKWKMSQNREAEDRDGVVRGLRSRGDGDDLRVADAVSAALDPRAEP